MDEAIVVCSRKGFFKTEIKAHEIHSREQARKLWPLVSSEDDRLMVSWVKPSRDGRRSHFRAMPDARTLDIKQLFENEEFDRQRIVQESREHHHAKKLIAAELSRRLQSGIGMLWWFKDDDASDYPLEGNLLLGADSIATEHQLATPFGCDFRLDIAVLGPTIEKKPRTLGGLEIELSHAFDGRKALLSKSLGFPLISIDISEMSIEEITPEWAQGVLSASTRNHEGRRRQTYIYLHDLLYPLYTKIPDFIDPGRRHQYIVFTDDKALQQLVSLFNKLSKELGYPPGDIAVSVVNSKSDQSKLVFKRITEIFGPEWQLYNKKQCLRLTVPRAAGCNDLRGHRFHMTLARVLLSDFDALVGYRYSNGIDNTDPNEDIWIHHHWKHGHFTAYRVLPKRLAEPMSRLMHVIGDLQKSSRLL